MEASLLMDKNKPKTMEEFGTWFKRTTLAYVALIFVLVLSYGYLVKGGSWGSLSDVVIAVFTILIAYTTNLILIAAWLASNDWNKEKKYELGLSLLSNLVSFYALCWELRVLRVRSFHEYKWILMEDKEIESCSILQDDDATNECIKNVKIAVKDSKEELMIIKRKIKELESRAEKLHGNCLLEASIYGNDIVEKVDEFVKQSKNIKTSNKGANTSFNDIAKLVLHSPRNLPNLPSDKETLALLNDYSNYSHLDEIDMEFADEH